MPRTQTERLWLIGGGLVALVLLLIGYFFFVGPQRDKTGQVNDEISSAQSENDVLQARIATLTAQSRKISTYRRELSQAQLALPTSSGIPDFLRTLQSIGNATSTDVSALTVGIPTPVVPAGVTTETPTESATSAAPESTNDPATGTTTSTPASSAAQAYALPITAQVAGSPAELDAFLVQLQSVQPRAVLISSLTESAASTTGAGSSGSSLSLTMQAFVASTTAVTSQSPAAGTP